MTNEAEFNTLAEATLEAIVGALETSGVDCDCEFRGEGVLELEFENGSKIIVNRHAPAQEIWVAARSGGYHFRFDGARWVNTRNAEDLYAVLSRCVSEQSGAPAVLTGRT